MGIHDERLGYLLDELSQSDVVGMTGIPASTLSYVSRGIRTLPVVHEKALRNAYQREARFRMEDSGFSGSQRNRFASFAPSTVRKVTKDVQDKIEYLAWGTAKSMIARMATKGIILSTEDALEVATKQVKEGFLKSKWGYEKWMEYGKGG